VTLHNVPLWAGAYPLVNDALTLFYGRVTGTLAVATYPAMNGTPERTVTSLSTCQRVRNLVRHGVVYLLRRSRFGQVAGETDFPRAEMAGAETGLTVVQSDSPTGQSVHCHKRPTVAQSLSRVH
jgi:hypothetical protein